MQLGPAGKTLLHIFSGQHNTKANPEARKLTPGEQFSFKSFIYVRSLVPIVHPWYNLTQLLARLYTLGLVSLIFTRHQNNQDQVLIFKG